MVLFDAFDHRTETRILMSQYAQEDQALREELITHGELIPIEPGAQAVVETTNLRMLATVTDLRYAEQEPRGGIFQRVVVALDVTVKQLPPEGAAAGNLGPAQAV